MNAGPQILKEVLDKIKKHVGISGKEGGRYKIYFLKNGNVAYIRYSNIRTLSNRQYGTYYFIVSVDKFKEYKDKFRLILSCGSSENTLIVPSKDIENLFKNVNISTDNKWYFYISADMILKDIDISKYLNRWELLNGETELEENMTDNIRESDSRSKIHDIISNTSRQNKKCNHLYLCNDLYAQYFEKYEILAALKALEQEDVIYKIIYVNWYIKEKYKEIDLQEEDQLLIDIFTAIKNFSSRHDWQYGLRKSDLYDKLFKKRYTEDDIRDALELLEERKIIYKKSFIHWFTKEYQGDLPNGDIVEGKEDVIYMPDKIEEYNLGNESYDTKIENIEDMQNTYSDIPFKVEFLIKQWKELKEKKEKMEYEKQREIDLQKELEHKKEESINREKELEEKILDISREKEILEKLFEPIRLKHDEISQKAIKERLIEEKIDIAHIEEKNEILEDIKEKDQSIDATEILSELTGEDIDILLKKEMEWYKVRLKSWRYLDIEDSFRFKSGDEIIIIDMTEKLWVKQLGYVSNKDETQISGVTNIFKRYLFHDKCNNSIMLKENSIYCEECGYEVQSKNIYFKSSLSDKLLDIRDIIMGETLIDNGDKPIILIDLEYGRRDEKAA